MKTATGNRSQFSLLLTRGIRQVILFALTVTPVAAQQQVIPLYKGVAPGSENWNWEEKEFFVKVPLNSKIAYNVTRPTLTVFRPETPNGTAVIVCPGGGLQVLNIEREGINVAKELVKKGITVFVFKYRLVQSVTDDPWTEMRNNIANPDSFRKKTAVISNMARTDVNLAIAYVRQHAKEFKLDSTRIGLMGFSAGGVLSAWAAYNFMPETRPDFVAPIYCVISSIQERTVKPDAPPLFIVAASDDQLAPVSNSVNLYNDWINARRSAELHIYAKGGHGLRGAPAESWLDRFTEWLTAQGFLKAGQ